MSRAWSDTRYCNSSNAASSMETCVIYQIKLSVYHHYWRGINVQNKQQRWSSVCIVDQDCQNMGKCSQILTPHEHRREADRTLRVVYGASIRSCHPCPLREQCQWNGKATAKPRQVSVLLHPLAVGNGPLLWRDWSRRVHRRACLRLLRNQRVEVRQEPATLSHRNDSSVLLSRAMRAHTRLSWAERLARNARQPTTGRVTMRLFGVPETVATSFGFAPA
jgi:hypothetical protein